MVRRIAVIILVLLAFTPGPAYCQTTSDTAGHPYYGEGYVAASFPGGAAALAQFLVKEIRYPYEAREADVQGRVIIRIFIDENGRTANQEIVRGIGAGCDREAMRVALKMPQWQPATYGHKPVASWQELCVNFRLE